MGTHSKEQTNPRTLIERAKQGDEKAFGALYDTYFVPIFRYIYARTKRKEDTEDLAQQVFLKIYKSLPTFSQQGDSPLTYFFTVARNTVVDYWRKKKNVVSSPDQAFLHNIQDSRKNPDQLAQDRDLQELLSGAIRTLTQDQQEVVILRFVNELSNKEISEVLQKSEEAVRQLQWRALQVLRKRLKTVAL